MHSSKPPLAGFLRVRIVAGAVSVLAFVATVVFALAGIFSHQAMLGTAALIGVITCGFAKGAIETCRGYFLWSSGAWAGLSGELITREQQPARFMTWLTMHLLFAVVWVGVAGYLTWTLVERL